MHESALLKSIGQRKSDKEQIANRVAENPRLIPEVLGGLRAKRADTKYGCAKVLRIISEKYPHVLYPSIDFFIGLLQSDNTILRWEGIHVLGNLAAVDSENKIDEILDEYLDSIGISIFID